MKLGVTATRQGTTPRQRDAFRTVVQVLNPSEFHHGDCVGGDEESHRIVSEILPDVQIYVHPPEDPKHRAFVDGPSARVRILGTRPYLDRNRDIVDAVEVLVAMPAEEVEKLRSGTWATVRYARRIGKQVIVIAPDGSHQ